MNSKVTMVLRIVLAIILIVFGANKFGKFMEMPPMPEDAMTYMKGLGVTKIMFPLLGVLEILIGVLLITKKAVPFALILLAPIAFNMVLFHATLAPGGIGPAAAVFVLNAILIYANWDRFKSLFA
jgi:uncharacterized membrane protein YphA (DoxX/SURF4 family)